ncbi:MAG TPA: S9 family peptidase [Luteimonas sp.]|nr:S9 family peptidase [Luteimonas sp.]
MKTKLILVATLVCAATPVLAQIAPAKLETSGALFGVRETVEQIDMSPDGSKIVYLTPGPGRVSLVYVADLVGGEPQQVLASSGNPDRLRWCNFASNERLVCKLVGQADVDGTMVPFSRLLAVDTNGKNARPLGENKSRYDARIRQFDGEILDWLPDDNGAVLMAREYVPEVGKMNTLMVRKTNGLGIDRIDVVTMDSTPVEGAAKSADFFIADGRGHVRMKGFREQHGIQGLLSSRLNYSYRLPGSMEWKAFSSLENGIGMAALAVDEGSNSAYVLKKLDGRQALYRVKLDGSMAAELIYKNDKVDVDDVVRVGRGSRVIGLTYAEDKRSVVYFDDEYHKLSVALGKAVPNLPTIGFVASSANNNKLLVHASSDSDPGRYYVYDKTARTLNEIMLARPALEHVTLASVKPITYPAADGTAIPAYLTLPPGKETARGLPAVVLPHGGPSARDEWGFDWLAQFLAHEGYAVLQPNYRGSAGFGDAWLQTNGFKSWRTSIGDVTAAARWLAQAGIADPKRLAIVGWSYGGYAALQSGVTEPDLFKAIVAIAPATDLELLKREARQYTSASLVADEIGSGPHIVEGSPLQNVGKIKAPVLMFQGSADINVDPEQSRKMDTSLRAAGKASELVVYAGLEHSLADSNARAQMLDKIAAFLRGNLGDQ